MEYTVYCEFDRKDIIQYESLIKRLRFRTFYLVMHIVVAVVLTGLLALTLYLAVQQTLSGEILIRVLLLFLLVGFWFLTRENRIRMALAGHKKTGSFTIGFTQEHVTIGTEEKKEAFPYDQFTELCRFRGSYYLFVDKNKPFILPERCFVEGDPAAFGAFLAEKTGLEIKEIK